MTIVEKFRARGITPRAALYARFSSDNQREESIEAQLRAMHEYCEHNKIVVVHEFCDRAKSATTDDRPEFLNLIAASKEGEFDFAIVHKLDRFSRNRYDSAYYKRELNKNGVTLLSVLEQMDGSPESIILESVLEGMSEYYSKNLAREVMKGMKESALECRYLGGFIPYGFIVDKDTYQYCIGEHEAEAVRMVFRDIANGIGYNEVLTKLNALGYRTRRGNLFSKTTLYEMLRNEKYKGIYVFNRTTSKTENGMRNNHKNKPEDEVIRIPGGMPQIVDDDTFDRVQIILKGRTHNAPYAKAKESYMLSGRVFCGLCGASYNGNLQYSGRNKDKLVTYRCGKRHDHGDAHCGNKDVNRDYLESFVSKRIGEMVFNEKRIPTLIQAYYDSCGDLIGEAADRLREMRQSLKDMEQKIANIVNVIATTGSASLARALEQLEQDKEVLLIKIKQEEESLVANKLDEEEIVAAYRHAQELYENGTLSQRKQLLNLYLHKVVVYPEYVEIHINNVPTNILKPSQMHEDPALGGVLSYRFNGSAPAKTGKKKGSQRNDEFIISLAPAGGGEGS